MYVYFKQFWLSYCSEYVLSAFWPFLGLCTSVNDYSITKLVSDYFYNRLITTNWTKSPNNLLQYLSLITLELLFVNQVTLKSRSTVGQVLRWLLLFLFPPMSPPMQVRWGLDVSVSGAIRPDQTWPSASCRPAAALQSSAGPITPEAWPAPRAPRRSAPPSSRACTAQASRRRLTMDIITSLQTRTSQTTTRSTARRRTNSRRRRKGVRCGFTFWQFWFYLYSTSQEQS